MKKDIALFHEGKKPFECNICKSTLSRKGHLKSHVESVHEGRKSFKCDTCNYKCFQKNNLNLHIASVHEKKKPFKCELCNHSSSKKADMKNMLHLSMNRRSHSNVSFVTIVAFKNLT